MSIFWVDHEGKTGEAENAYEFQMQAQPVADKQGQGSDLEGSYVPNAQQGLEHSFGQFSEAQQRNFETKLTPEEEPKFQDWKQQHAPNDSGYDYDLRGAYLRGFTPSPENGHWPDTFKKPWHETFSDESVYAPDVPGLAGKWTGENRDIYVPGKARKYMDQNNPLHWGLEGLIKRTEEMMVDPEKEGWSKKGADDIRDMQKRREIEMLDIPSNMKERQAQARRSGAQDSADVSTYDHPEADLRSRMQMQENFLNHKKLTPQGPYTGLPEKEYKDLLWDTPIASSKGGGPAAADIQDMLDQTDEEHKARYDSFVKQLGGAGSVMGDVHPSGRIRVHKDLEGVQEYLKNMPEGVTAHEVGDGTVIIRKKPDKPPLISQNRDDEVDARQTNLANMIHDLRVKWMGDPEKWSTKEEVGNFINQAMSVMGGGFRINNKAPLPNVTVKTPTIERWAKYEEMSAQGKTTKQILKSTKLEPETVRDALGRDNLAIAAFNSENALTTAYFKSLEGLDPALQKALKNQVSVKDLKRYTRNLPEEQLKSIFEELPVSVKESFQSGEARRANIDAGKKTKIIAKPLKE